MAALVILIIILAVIFTRPSVKAALSRAAKKKAFQLSQARSGGGAGYLQEIV